MKTTKADRRKGAGGKPNLYQTRAIRVPIDLIPAITTKKRGHVHEQAGRADFRTEAGRPHHHDH